MTDDFKSRYKHIEKMIRGLIALCQTDAAGQRNLLDEIRNLSQTILNEQVKLLDNLMYLLFQKNISFKYPDEKEREKYKQKVFFPHAESQNDLSSSLGQAGKEMLNLNHTYPEIYQVIESHQPYHGESVWNRHLHDLANLGHIQLIPQKKRKLVQTPIGLFGEDQNVLIRNVCGVSTSGPSYYIENFEIQNGKVTGFDPTSMVYKTQYLVEDRNVDIIELCLVCHKRIEEIYLKLTPFL